MMWTTKRVILVCWLIVAAAINLPEPSYSATDTFVYGGCSQAKFSPASAYESNLNALLSSLVSSAALARYANLTVPGGGGASLYGLFQCRGDLDAGACSGCVSRAVAQLESICLDACGGVLQLEGCLVRYDNVSFVGVEDKTLVLKRCGPSLAFDDQDALTGLVGSLGSTAGPYRVGGTGGVQGVAQCVGDLGPTECQDCLTEAIRRLRSDCPMAQWADVYLAKCYARYFSGASHAPPGYHSAEKKDDDVEKTIAIIIGIVTLTLLLIVFLSFIGKQCRKLQDGK